MQCFYVSNTKEQSGRGFNLAATSALGHVTVALASAAPELDSTLINKLTDDKRSVVFDGAVRSVLCRRNIRLDEVKQACSRTPTKHLKAEVLWCASAMNRWQHHLPTTPLTTEGAAVAPVKSMRDLGLYIDAVTLT